MKFREMPGGVIVAQSGRKILQLDLDNMSTAEAAAIMEIILQALQATSPPEVDKRVDK